MAMAIRSHKHKSMPKRLPALHSMLFQKQWLSKSWMRQTRMRMRTMWRMRIKILPMKNKENLTKTRVRTAKARAMPSINARSTSQ